tara:strand:+ start:225 stop:440 length:216 start_codon:yes stop_codon:yes gene_type:complete
MNKQLKNLVRQAKPSPNLIWEDAELDRFAELVRADEREACALACESLKLSDDYYTHFYVEAIRARGKHEPT